MKNLTSWISVALCGAMLSASLLGGCSQETAAAEEPSAADTPVAVSVETLTTGKGSIQNEYVYSGKVMPRDTASVISLLSGTVERVNFKVGDRVEKGDVLFTLDTGDIEDSIRVQEAQLKAAKAQLQSAKTTLELVNGSAVESQLENARVSMQKAELAWQNAKDTYDRNKQLFDSGIISQSDMDQTEMGLTNAQLTYEQAKNSVDILNKMPEENIRKAKDGVAAAQASVETSQASLAGTRKKLEDAVVKSPISGQVSACNAVEGTLLAQSAGPAFVIINSDTVNISVSVSEQIVNSLAPGQDVSVTVAAASGAPVTGKIHTVSPAAGVTGAYDVEIEIANTDGSLKGGMFGEARFVREKKQGAIVLPRDAVVTANNESHVFVVEGGRARRVTVTTGIDTGSEIEITAGLSENQEVVVKGQNFLADGDAVQVSAPADAKGD